MSDLRERKKKRDRKDEDTDFSWQLPTFVIFLQKIPNMKLTGHIHSNINIAVGIWNGFYITTSRKWQHGGTTDLSV